MNFEAIDEKPIVCPAGIVSVRLFNKFKRYITKTEVGGIEGVTIAVRRDGDYINIDLKHYNIPEQEAIPFLRVLGYKHVEAFQSES